MTEPSNEGGNLVITRNPLRGPRRREIYDQRDDGRWDRREYCWGGCDWHYCGSEIVRSITVDDGAEVWA